MRSQALFYAWLAIAIAGPIAGLVVGPRLRRTLSRQAIVTLSIAAGIVVAAAFPPISFAGVLADHLSLQATYAWAWFLVGMARSRILRAVLVGLPTLAAVWILAPWSASFFLAIALSDLAQLPQRTMSLA